MNRIRPPAVAGLVSRGLLGVVFVTLKLCHVIDWSWWYVTMPFWLGLAVAVGIVIVAGLFLLGAHIIDAVRK